MLIDIEKQISFYIIESIFFRNDLYSEVKIWAFPLEQFSAISYYFCLFRFYVLYIIHYNALKITCRVYQSISKENFDFVNVNLYKRDMLLAKCTFIFSNPNPCNVHRWSQNLKIYRIGAYQFPD